VRNTIEHLVTEYEHRRLSRRELIAALAAVAAAPPPAAAQTPAPAAQGRSLNHVSIAVSDVEKSAAFYSRILGLRVVSRPGNGGINLGLGDGFLGLYRLANPGQVHHFCLGVADYQPERIARALEEHGVAATIDRNPANRTSGGDQLYFNDPDGTRVQLSAHGYQG
jgi:catechol 2,3-dioxygenase-like lactoylglutathione lyase family enzyme